MRNNNVDFLATIKLNPNDTDISCNLPYISSGARVGMGKCLPDFNAAQKSVPHWRPRLFLGFRTY
jgi:hypothetical protein